MLRKLGAIVTAVAVSALGVMLSAQPAHADGSTGFAIGPLSGTTPGGTLYTCNAAADVEWFVDLEIEPSAGLLYDANTTCNLPMKLEGTAEIRENGVVLSTRSFLKAFDTQGSVVGGLQFDDPGQNLELRYITKVTSTQVFFTWTTVPSGCTVSGKSITCTASTFFTLA